MTQTFDVRVYKSGNSKVFTIPAGVPIEVGDVFEVKVSKKKVLIKKKTKVTREEKIKDLQEALKKLGTPGLAMGMNAEELDEYLEGVYE